MKNDPSPPSVPAWLQGGFHAFLGRYLRRHFHNIAVSKEGYCPRSLATSEPLIVYANHPAWWDPLIAHFVNQQVFSPRQFYAPIDATALEKYKVFAKLGFYGVNLSSHSGASSFLTQSMAILEHPDTALWITPEGRFCDSRDHSATLMPGLAHVCFKLTRGAVLPMALEYVFWEERLPECLIRFGHPVSVAAHASRSKANWNEDLQASLRLTQSQLADEVISRDATRFETLLHGRSGAGGIYDQMRRLRSWVSGKKFRPEHGDKFR